MGRVGLEVVLLSGFLGHHLFGHLHSGKPETQIQSLESRNDIIDTDGLSVFGERNVICLTRNEADEFGNAFLQKDFCGLWGNLKGI